MIRPEIPEPKPRSLWKTIGRTVVVLGCLSVWWAVFYPADNPERKFPRHPCKNNLKQIGLAPHNYHDTYKSFPPAFVLGPDGKPWHSWRALILPFLEDESFAKKYRIDEPWNGPNNSKLLNQRPEVFACRERDGVVNVPQGQTSYVAVVSSETVWPGTTSTQVSDFADGTSNTAMVLEVRDAGIPWLAPYDLSFDEASAPPSEHAGRHPSSAHSGGGHVLMGDGTVRFVNTKLNADVWKALLTRAGGETIADY